MAILLSKTLITQLNNCYIDCSFSSSAYTNVVNIEVPKPDGDNVRLPFTIRTKDGYALKYNDQTGNAVFRFTKTAYKTSLSETEINTKYSNYFDEYNFNLIQLSNYKNADPILEYKPPTYGTTSGGKTTYTPLFEYSDIEEQKENIFIFNTGIVHKTYPIYLVSYYGNDPKRCKLDLIREVFSAPYEIKTTSGRMFKRYTMAMRYGITTNPNSGVSTTGFPISDVVSISAKAEKVGEEIEEDTTDGLFTTYIVSQSDLKKIADEGKIYTEIIVNTYSYPLKFNEDDLLETDIVLGNTPLQNNKAKRFQIAEPKIKIFSFNVPYLKDVESCKLLLPFNPEIVMDYDMIRGKKISGYIQYEISTNSSTLYIDDEDVEFYKDTITIETVVPFKPTGEYKNFKEAEKRLGKQVPTLLIKCLQEEKQQHFMQGSIEYPIAGILKDELDLLNSELQKGVITNE